MAEFKSCRSYWDFAEVVIRKTRYVHAPEIEEFLNTLRETSKSRIQGIAKGTSLWRAQLGHDLRPIIEEGEEIADEPLPLNRQRMKPLESRAKEGRANPKGIPYLYTATNQDTALAEVRPWVQSLISVALFKVQRDLRILNFHSDDKWRVYFKEPSAAEKEKAVWLDVDRAFASPVTLSDDSADYASTQIIAELFKGQGLDGIAYRSSLGPGHNVALYDLGAAELSYCTLFQVKHIKFDFTEAGNPYYVKERDGSDDRDT